MRWGIGYPLSVLRETFATMVGWTAAMLFSTALGFFVGYWLGHGELMPLGTTFNAMLYLPVVWIQCPLVLIGFAVAAFGWYAPIHFESEKLRLTALLVNLATWIVVIAVEVERCSHLKFWHW